MIHVANKSRNYYPSRGGMYNICKNLYRFGFVSKLLSLTWRDVLVKKIKKTHRAKEVSKLLSLTWRDVFNWDDEILLLCASRNYYPSRGGMYKNFWRKFFMKKLSRNYYPSRGGMYI